MTPRDDDKLLTLEEVAALFRVGPKTVTRWAAAGKLPEAVRTMGGHRRWRESAVRAVLDGTAGCVKCTHPLGSREHLVACLGAKP